MPTIDCSLSNGLNKSVKIAEYTILTTVLENFRLETRNHFEGLELDEDAYAKPLGPEEASFQDASKGPQR